MKDDEYELLTKLQEMTKNNKKLPYVRHIVKELEMNEKRAYYILTKWAGKGWYEYGISAFAGWLTEEGLSIETIKYPEGYIGKW